MPECYGLTPQPTPPPWGTCGRRGAGNDPKTALEAKIERAVDYYRKKYGHDPNLCLIHPGALENPASVDGAGEKPKKGKAAGPVNKASGVAVRPYRPVLPGHLWIGVEEEN